MINWLFRILFPNAVLNLAALRSEITKVQLAIAAKNTNDAADHIAECMRIIAKIIDPTP